MRIALLGSCVSREAFRHRGGEEGWRLPRPDLYIARSSLVSLMSPPLPVPGGLLRSIRVPWERDWLNRDFNRSFWHKLAQTAPDVLLLDLIDERFDLYGRETAEGEGYKLAVWDIAAWARRQHPFQRLARRLRGSEVPAGREPPRRESLSWLGYRLIARESEEAWRLWTAAAAAFFARLDREFPRLRLLLHRAPLVERFVDGGKIELRRIRHGWRGPGNLVRNFGPLLRRYYDHLVALRPNLELLDVPVAEHSLRRKHPWLEAPFHYQDGYHRWQAAELRRRHGLPPSD